MKKMLLVMLIILIITMSACTTDVKEQQESILETTVAEEIKNVSEHTLYLDELLKSKEPKKLMEVARSQFATEKQLKVLTYIFASNEVFSECFESYFIRQNLIRAIIANPVTTDEVLEVAVKHDRTIHFKEEIASTPKAGSKTLKIIADTCVLHYNRDKEYNTWGRVVEAISTNPSTTDEIMEKLVAIGNFDVFKIVATSEKSGEKALMAVAKECFPKKENNRWSASLQLELAEALANNLSTTKAIMQETAKSEFVEVVEFGHAWIENGNEWHDVLLQKALEEDELTNLDELFSTFLEVATCEFATEDQLKLVAANVYRIDYYERWSIIDALMANSSTTDEVLAIVAHANPDREFLKALASSCKAGPVTLREVVDSCIFYADFGLEQDPWIEVIRAVSNNPSATPEILEMLDAVDEIA